MNWLTPRVPREYPEYAGVPQVWTLGEAVEQGFMNARFELASGLLGDNRAAVWHKVSLQLLTKLKWLIISYAQARPRAMEWSTADGLAGWLMDGVVFRC